MARAHDPDPDPGLDPGLGRGAATPVWARRRARGEGWMISLRVQPGQSRTLVAGVVGEQLKVKVTAPPNEGKANAELLRFLGESFGVPLRELRIRQGHHGRSKVVEISADVPLPRSWPR